MIDRSKKIWAIIQSQKLKSGSTHFFTQGVIITQHDCLHVHNSEMVTMHCTVRIKTTYGESRKQARNEKEISII